LAILDRMMEAPAPEKPAEAPRNPHAGAASATGPVPTKSPLDEAAELFKAIFKGDIVP